MIIGTILENSLSAQPDMRTGVTSVIFYTEADCIRWCVAMSEQVTIGSSALTAATVFYNTDTGVRRWWFSGTEYTG